jgi:hypothetical protein
MKHGEKPPVRVFFPRSAVLLLASLFLSPIPSRAADLTEVYRLAREQDPAYTAARHALDAARQRIPQARAALLPSVALTGGNSRNRSDVDFGRDSPAQDRDIRSWNWTVQLTQPLLRLPSHHALDEAEFLAEQAQAQFDEAGQELILRVAQACFDVVAAEDGIAVADAQLKAMNEQLAIAKRGFTRGTATITDTHEANSRVALARAERVEAMNDLETKRAELEKIAGDLPQSLAVLRPGIVAPTPQPDDAREWIGHRCHLLPMDDERTTRPFHLVPLKEVEPIRPVLHHAPALFHVVDVIVGRVHRVWVGMGELRFHLGPWIADLVERRRERAANAVRRQPAKEAYSAAMPARVPATLPCAGTDDGAQAVAGRPRRRGRSRSCIPGLERSPTHNGTSAGASRGCFARSSAHPAVRLGQ